MHFLFNLDVERTTKGSISSHKRWAGLLRPGNFMQREACFMYLGNLQVSSFGPDVGFLLLWGNVHPLLSSSLFPQII